MNQQININSYFKANIKWIKEATKQGRNKIFKLMKIISKENAETINQLLFNEKMERLESKINDIPLNILTK